MRFSVSRCRAVRARPPAPRGRGPERRDRESEPSGSARGPERGRAGSPGGEAGRVVCVVRVCGVCTRVRTRAVGSGDQLIGSWCHNIYISSILENKNKTPPPRRTLCIARVCALSALFATADTHIDPHSALFGDTPPRPRPGVSAHAVTAPHRGGGRRAAAARAGARPYPAFVRFEAVTRALLFPPAYTPVF